MTITKLLAEIDLADADLKAAQTEEAAAVKRREAAAIRSAALHRALVLVNGEAPQPAPEEEPTERAPRRDIPSLILGAIDARLEISPLLESEAVEYLFITTAIRRSAIEAALRKLIAKKLVGVADDHLWTEAHKATEEIPLFEDRRAKA